jgi:NAD(P)-dependent dehydrogenase (short-subunit alcohol dehydrogenase family)
MTDLLRNQVCVVTGACQGIGWALTLALADLGARVFICDISSQKVESATARLPSLPWPDRVVVRQVDVADRNQIETWIRDIQAETGRIDVLVNNAAFVRWEDVSDMSVEDAVRTMEVGYDAMVFGIKTVLPLMKESAGGHIVNVGSSVVRIYVGGASAAYAAAKAAMDAYTQMLQLELAHSSIHVMLVRLATVGGTDFFRQHVPSNRMPRLADFLPYLTPPSVADGIVRGIIQRKAIVDMPGWLAAFYLMFNLAPGLMRRMIAVGGASHKDYGQVEWEYTPHGPGKPR